MLVAWLLTTTPQYPVTFFKKAGQMTGIDSVGRHYRPRLLESLLPLLTLLITSCHAPEHHSSDINSPSSKPRRNFKIELKREQSDDVLDGRYVLPTSLSLVDDDMAPIHENSHLKILEIYIACLARLSKFTDNKGTFRCLWEDARQHPKLEQLVIDKLVVFADPGHRIQVGLRSAATKVLSNYELDIEGKPVRSPVTVVWSVAIVMRSAVSSVATVLRSAASLIMLNANSHEEQRHPDLQRPVELATRVEPHSSGKIEEA